MKYTSDEAMAEIMRRRDAILVRRSRRRERTLMGLSGTLSVSLLLTICLLSGSDAGSPAGSVYGSFLLSAESGGYVLAAVIAFALGVCTTLLCLQYLKRRSTKKEKETGKNNTVQGGSDQ